MVLNMVFDFASNNVRTNAVRAIHQLVECVANANPAKTLAKFLPFCAQNIRTELEHGASSVRTTSLNSMPLPADATLHWSKFALHPRLLSNSDALDRSCDSSRIDVQVSNQGKHAVCTDIEP